MLGSRLLRALSGALFVLAFVFGVGILSHGHAGGAASAAGDCTADPSQDAEEQRFLQLINDYRAQNSLPPLALSYTLSKASQWKSNDMGAYNYFGHDDLTRTWVQRIRDCGYGYNTWAGENIVAGTIGAQPAFDAWRNSPGHNANMLSVYYTAVGIGRAYVPNSTYQWYWTTDFGGTNDGWPAVTQTPAATGTPTITATKTPTPTRTAIPMPTAIRTPIPNCYGDVNRDGVVNSTDRLLISRQYTSMVPYDVRYDVNRDGRVNSTDLLLVSRYPSLCNST